MIHFKKGTIFYLGKQSVGISMSFDRHFWKCSYCGTQDNEGSACPNCAASRPDDVVLDKNRPKPTDTSYQEIWE